MNKKVVESLVKVGALDQFGKRSALIASLETIRDKYKPRNNTDQQGLFGEDLDKIAGPRDFKLPEMSEFTDDELQRYEKQLLGFSLSGKPISELVERFRGLATHRISQIESGEQISDMKIVGIIGDMRIVVTRRTGDEMAFAKVDDGTGKMEVVIFPKVYKLVKGLLMAKKPLVFAGKLEVREDSQVMIVGSLSDPLLPPTDAVVVSVPKHVAVGQLASLKNLLLKHPGSSGVVLRFEGTKKDFPLPFKITWSPELAELVSDLLQGAALR